MSQAGHGEAKSGWYIQRQVSVRTNASACEGLIRPICVCTHAGMCGGRAMCWGGGVVFQVVKCSRTPETEDFLKMLRKETSR